MVSDGASRMSSVFGLKVTPSTAMILPLGEPPQMSNTLSTMRRLTSSFTLMTVSVSCIGTACSCPIRASARVSLGKQLPPYPGPACRNLDPMRPSDPMPLETALMSAPVRSQRAAISLMKVILVARKALAAYLIISALSRSVVMIGKSRR